MILNGTLVNREMSATQLATLQAQRSFLPTLSDLRAMQDEITTIRAQMLQVHTVIAAAVALIDPCVYRWNCSCRCRLMFDGVA